MVRLREKDRSSIRAWHWSRCPSVMAVHLARSGWPAGSVRSSVAGHEERRRRTHIPRALPARRPSPDAASRLDARGMAWKERCVGLLRHPDGDGISPDAIIASWLNGPPRHAVTDMLGGSFGASAIPEVFSDVGISGIVALRAVSRLGSPKVRGLRFRWQFLCRAAPRRHLRFACFRSVSISFCEGCAAESTSENQRLHPARLPSGRNGPSRILRDPA